MYRMNVDRVITMALAMIAVAVFGTAQPVLAANWTNSAGGIFSNAANWDTSTAPDDTETTTFGIGDTYEVDFDSSWTNENAVFSSGTATLDVGVGNTWTLDRSYTGLIVQDTATTVIKSGSVKAKLPEVDPGGTLRIENGGILMAYGSDGSSVGLKLQGLGIIDGGQVLPDGNGGIYLNSNDGILIVTNGGLVVSSPIHIGDGVLNHNNQVIVTGPGSGISNSTVSVGYKGMANSLHVRNGGFIKTLLNNMTLGYHDGATNNQLIVEGPNSEVEAYQFFVGYSTVSGSTGHSLIVTNGARFKTTRITNSDTTLIGADNTSITVTGDDSRYESSSKFSVHGSHCAITVTDNALLTNGTYVTTIGAAATSVSNVVRIADGAAWRTSGSIYMEKGIGHALYIEDDGALYLGDNGQLRIGGGGTADDATNCLLSITGGSLSVAASTGYLYIRNGSTLAINGPGGNIEVSNFFMDDYGPNHLNFTIPATGITPITVTRQLDFTDITLTIDATAYGDAGGGKVTLVDYSGALTPHATYVKGIPLDPGNVSITPASSVLNWDDNDKVTLEVPYTPPEGTVITIR